MLSSAKAGGAHYTSLHLMDCVDSVSDVINSDAVLGGKKKEEVANTKRPLPIISFLFPLLTSFFILVLSNLTYPHPLFPVPQHVITDIPEP